MPLNTKYKIGRPVKYIKDKKTFCLTMDQARHSYKKVELEGVVSIATIKQKIEEDNLSKDNLDDDKVNTHHNIIINNINMENIMTSQMEQWSLLSNMVNYVPYDRNPKNFYDLDVKEIDQKNHSEIYDRLIDEDVQVFKIRFWQ